MKNINAIKELGLIQDGIVEDLLALTPEQVREEARECEVDLHAMVERNLSVFETAFAAVRRQRLEQARTAMKSVEPQHQQPRSRPSLQNVRALLESLSASDLTLKLAFREGKVQTANDIMSLYDDFVRLGKIKPLNNED